MVVTPTPQLGVNATCARDELVDAVQLVGRAVSTRSAVQILTSMLLRGEGERLELAATDMEMSLRAGLRATVTDEGTVAIPGRLFVDIARLLPPGEVSLDYRHDENMLELCAGTSSYRLHTYDTADFPRLPEVHLPELVRVDRKAFIDTIVKVGRAASRDESRPVLTGVLVRLEGAQLVMAATDSYRLSVKETALPSDSGQELDAIVPARALAELVRIAQGSATGEIAIGVQENQVVFSVDGVLLTARRIDGQFPNYAQLRPESFEVEVSLPREELLGAVRRVGLMAQRNSPLRLRFAPGEITIQSQTQDVGEASESMPAAYAGDVLEIGFNPDFLREGLESVEEDEVRLRLITPLRPGLISGAREDFWYLIMPIRLAG